MPLLKEVELDAFIKFDARSAALDNSITTKILTPVWNLLVLIVPPDVAPNALSLAALISLLHASYISYYYSEEAPQQTAGITAAFIFMFWMLDALDSIHAEKIGGAHAARPLF